MSKFLMEANEERSTASVNGCVDNRPKMNEPAEEKNPEDGRQDKLNQRREGASLYQLPEAGDKETANGCEYIAGGAGAGAIRHLFFLDHLRPKSKRGA